MLEMLAYLKRYRQKSTDRILEQTDFALRRGAMEENSVLTSGIRIFECCNAPGAKNTIPKQTAQGKVQNKLTGLELSD